MLRDIFFMRKALSLAEKAAGCVSPNPLVGAVIARHTTVLGQGYHKKAGASHAEIEAIESASGSLDGATLYVTLEPCCHHGRTPPCVDRIIKEKIARVVIAVKDPNPQVSGRSMDTMRRAGIEVRAGVFEEEARKQNEIFFMNMQHQRPFVTAKWAMTLDGTTADAKGTSKWITSTEARSRAKELRFTHDAVCVGITTVLKDDPDLGVSGKKIKKVIFDPMLKTPASAKLFKNASEVFIVHDGSRSGRFRYPKNAVSVSVVSGKSGMSIKKVLCKLYKEGVTSIFLEGGGNTTGRFFDAGLIDKVYVFTAPRLFGHAGGRRPIAGKKFADFSKIVDLKDYRHRLVGECYMTEGYPVYRR